MATPANGEPQREWVPRPDPTLLTTEQSNRLRAEMQREVQALREIFETRLGAMDLATELLRASLAKVASTEELNRRLIDMTAFFCERLEGTRKEFLEKFSSIQNQFRERDVRTDQASVAQTTAVNAALQAQKEAAGAQNESNAAAITKSEAATTKQIDGIQLNISNSTAALNDKIADLRRSIDRGEATIQGASDTRTDTRQSVGMILGIIGGSFGLIMTIVAVITLVVSLSHSLSPVAQGAPLTVTVPAQK